MNDGIDFTATQDQALAAVTEVLQSKPHQFIFIAKPRNPDDGDISCLMFCHAQFVFDAASVLGAALAQAEDYPAVAPPPED